MKRQICFLIALFSLISFACQEPKVATLWMIGDSTMADYANYGEDYMKERYPQMGWGQALPDFLVRDSLKEIDIFWGDSIILQNKARGGRSSRSFFEESRWREIYEQLKSD